MVASVRSVAATPLQGTSGAAERGDVEVGDILLAFQSADGNGGTSSFGISGGSGSWQRDASLQGPVWSGSVIWRKTVTGPEPATYTVTQGGSDPDVVTTILALRGADPTGIIITSAAGTTAPAASPASASGLEIRYSAGAASGATVTWAQLPGYDGLDIQSRSFTTASLAVRPYLSSAPLPGLDMAPSPAFTTSTAHAFTILIKSAAGGSSGPPPTPPTFPASTPGKGVSWMRYTVHDMLTGQYRGDIHPSGVVLDRRIGEPGTWKGKLSLANTDRANRINEILPRDPNDLTSGEGRLVIHTWRGGALWGLHWLHTTLTVKDERGELYMDLQASTLDGYLLHVALEEDIAEGDDQLSNARALIQHMQATPGSNIGLGLMAGVSETVRPLLAAPGPNVTYGQVLADYARQADGFETVINLRIVDGALIRSWEHGEPIISRDVEHVFVEAAEGGDITTWREERSVLRGGTRWGAWGGTPEQGDATESSSPARSALVTTPHVAAGHPIVDRRVQHPTDSTDQGDLDAYAARWAARAAGAPPVFSADVVIGKASTFDPNGLGDYVKYKLNNPRYPITADGASSFNLRQRLVGWELTPAERGSGGKDRLKLITEQASEAP